MLEEGLRLSFVILNPFAWNNKIYLKSILCKSKQTAHAMQALFWGCSPCLSTNSTFLPSQKSKLMDTNYIHFEFITEFLMNVVGSSPQTTS